MHLFIEMKIDKEEVGIAYLIGSSCTGVIILVVMLVVLLVMGGVGKMNKRHMAIGLQVLRVGFHLISAIALLALMVSGVFVQAVTQSCHHFQQVVTQQPVYNSSHLFFSSSLQNSLQDCWFTSTGHFKGDKDYNNLTGSVEVIEQKLKKIESI